MERRGLGGRVTFHGHVDEEEKARLLARAWVALTASSAEGWCLTVFEAARLRHADGGDARRRPGRGDRRRADRACWPTSPPRRSSCPPQLAGDEDDVAGAQARWRAARRGPRSRPPTRSQSRPWAAPRRRSASRASTSATPTRATGMTSKPVRGQLARRRGRRRARSARARRAAASPAAGAPAGGAPAAARVGLASAWPAAGPRTGRCTARRPRRPARGPRRGRGRPRG